ncbi:MAG: thiamine pyrophosphate-binding protein [Xanthomonadales bacterium]|nr:thiamine pyrophosphate-binding protein [Xanthomonadales bacterium]
MKKSGAWLVRFALEQIGVKHTFGIPGVHNTEIYDELNKSEQIRPILVTHEGGGAFMAEAISRTSEQTGTLLIVPAAGVTHAASGIGEAFLDGVPMLVICGGIRSDVDMTYQLHEMDQQSLLKPITKKTYKVETHADIIPSIYAAYTIANQGEPGPVFVEVPVNLQLFPGEVTETPVFEAVETRPEIDMTAIQNAAKSLYAASKPGLFVGWGAVDASAELIKLAEYLNAPVSTTLQGLSAFPANHPLHTGMSFGKASVPASENAFKDCDCMLAVATRFSEIATGSFGVVPPENLIHTDINPQVFNANYPAAITIKGDAKVVLNALLKELQTLGGPKPDNGALKSAIKSDKAAYFEEWFKHDSKDRVNHARFFVELRKQLDDDAIVIADDGNHTFLTAELMPIHTSRGFISPTDFNCMGYCTPAVIGSKLANPDKQVVGIIGDGAFLMTCMETLTANSLGLGGVYFVFSDGELSQISQAQEIPYNRKTCTVLPTINLKGVADATGCEFISINDDTECADAISTALRLAAQNRPVIVDVKIDYSKRTRFTKGIVKTNLDRFTTGNKARFIGRALVRKVTG